MSNIKATKRLAYGVLKEVQDLDLETYGWLCMSMMGNYYLEEDEGRNSSCIPIVKRRANIFALQWKLREPAGWSEMTFCWFEECCEPQ